jgi:hypothetical protein
MPRDDRTRSRQSSFDPFRQAVDSRSRGVLLLAVAVAAVAGVALYQPALRIGLLSDDYALLMWARRLELFPRDWGQIRPLPILAWWLLAEVTPPARTPASLHALNIALHAVNSILVGVIAGRLVSRAEMKPGTTAVPGASLVSAALFLAMPLAVEPVAWGSGVFDVMLATLSLTLAVVVTRRQQLTPADQALCLLVAMAMLATKETGVIAGPLVLLVYWSRWGRIDRSVLAVAMPQIVLAALYAVTRELTGRLDHRLTPRFDLESIARLISGVGRAFIVPLHRDIVITHLALTVVCAIAIILTMAAWLWRCRHSPGSRRVAMLAAVGTALCVAPAIRLFGITPDLQGARYLYLAGAWWSIALAAALMEGWSSSRMRTAMSGLATVAIIGAAFATRAHLQPWTAARAERDRVLLRLISVPLSCRQVAASPAPDNVAGAYVFRNGLNEALATLGRSYDWVTSDQAVPECQVDLTH